MAPAIINKALPIAIASIGGTYQISDNTLSIKHRDFIMLFGMIFHGGGVDSRFRGNDDPGLKDPAIEHLTPSFDVTSPVRWYAGSRGLIW